LRKRDGCDRFTVNFSDYMVSEGIHCIREQDVTGLILKLTF